MSVIIDMFCYWIRYLLRGYSALLGDAQRVLAQVGHISDGNSLNIVNEGMVTRGIRLLYSLMSKD